MVTFKQCPKEKRGEFRATYAGIQDVFELAKGMAGGVLGVL